MKPHAMTVERRRVVGPVATATIHPNHRSLHQTMACGECMRRFWDAQGRLEAIDSRPLASAPAGPLVFQSA
jgi:hypothetical protein